MGLCGVRWGYVELGGVMWCLGAATWWQVGYVAASGWLCGVSFCCGF